MTVDAECEGLTANQREIANYWHERQRKAGVVTRSDIDPGHLKTHLGFLSLLDVTGQEPVFRLVGSRLRDRLGMDARGCKLSDIPAKAAQRWARGLTASCERGAPLFGLSVEGGRVHAWLRAPLFNRSGAIAQILCHDEILSNDDLRRERPEMPSIPASGQSAAA